MLNFNVISYGAEAYFELAPMRSIFPSFYFKFEKMLLSSSPTQILIGVSLEYFMETIHIDFNI
jgi:hypothetical protein